MFLRGREGFVFGYYRYYYSYYDWNGWMMDLQQMGLWDDGNKLEGTICTRPCISSTNLKAYVLVLSSDSMTSKVTVLTYLSMVCEYERLHPLDSLSFDVLLLPSGTLGTCDD